MSASLRNFGLAGAVVVAAALVASALLRERPGPRAPDELPPGFQVSVAGLGPNATAVETAVRGPVAFLNQVEVPGAAGTRLVPLVRIDGRDPEPVDGDRMRLHEVLVTRYAETDDADVPPRVLLTVRAPEGVAPLLLDNALPTVDRGRPLDVRQPGLEIPGVLGGRSFALVTGLAQVNLETNEVTCAGPFELISEGLYVAGSDLRLDPATRTLHFGARDGAVHWRFDDGALTYTGSSDAGGFLQPLPDGRQLFTLPARERCHVDFPARAEAPEFFPARLDARGARLFLERGAGGWRPQRAEGDGPLRWRGPYQLLEGSACTLLWDAAGACEGLDLSGPLSAARAGVEPGFASSRGGGFFAPDGRSMYLYGGGHAWGWPADGWSTVSAAWIDAGRRSQRAGGGVAAEAPRLSALGDGFERRGDDQLVLSGGALLYPDSASLRTAAAQRIEHDLAGATRASGGFHLTGCRDDAGAPWSLRGGTLEAEEQEGVLWLDAQDALILERDGARFYGERLIARGEDYAVLSGPRTSAEVPRPEGGAWRAEADRFVQEESGLLAQGAPVVRVPAAALGLDGDEVIIRSSALRYRRDDRTWEWSRGVQFAGALRGGAESATWREGEALQLRGGAPALAGTSADGAAFALAADRLDLAASGAADLDGNADARFARRNQDGALERLHLRGTRGHIEESGGWFEGRASAESARETAAETRLYRGEAQRIEWQLRDRRLSLLQCIGAAHLSGPDGEAWGAQVNFDEREAGRRYLEMWGSAGAPARLKLPEGRDAAGEWLRLDLDTRLLSTAKGTFRGSVP